MSELTEAEKNAIHDATGDYDTLFAAVERILDERDRAAVGVTSGEVAGQQWRAVEVTQMQHALDAARRAGAVAELLVAARLFEYEMADAWGRDAQWISTGSHVADLVAAILREQAAALRDDA